MANRVEDREEEEERRRTEDLPGAAFLTEVGQYVGATEAICGDSPIQQACPCTILPDGCSTCNVEDNTLVVMGALVYGGHVPLDWQGDAVPD